MTGNTKRSKSHSVISAQRWIHSNELKPGMYVSELDVPWEKTTFMFQGFVVETAEEVQAVQRQATYVRVKTEKVSPINPKSYTRLCGTIR